MLQRRHVIVHRHGIVISNRQVRARLGNLIAVVVRQLERRLRDAFKLRRIDPIVHGIALIHRIHPPQRVNLDLRHDQRRLALQILISPLLGQIRDAPKRPRRHVVPLIPIQRAQRVHRVVIHRPHLIKLRHAPAPRHRRRRRRLLLPRRLALASARLRVARVASLPSLHRPRPRPRARDRHRHHRARPHRRPEPPSLAHARESPPNASRIDE